ncbi:dCMP deaminase family protein [Mycoplasma marinum]|uniref:Cytidine deaminase n=1 Tax=Mycoplasma marinum TaxID=1937190 RepID=A0A4R0XJR3_9MOLU|nr:dCMP deaminase family protein [Mycoplasma marinum]TCG10886.1 cytidine deaminase [Mycoplasma marinum]
MNNILEWDEYFLAMSKLAAKRSKDPNTQVGACIVNDKKRIVGLGYNGMPKGNDNFPWTREGEDNKYKYVIHAESNAILNSIKNLDGATIYVSLFPCNECAKMIVQSGIKKVVFEDNKYKDSLEVKVAEKIFLECGVETKQIKLEEIIIK